MPEPRWWATDLAVLRLSGHQVIEHADHFVVRCLRNPGHHWGNFVLVTDPAAVDSAPRWLEVFGRNFPAAEHVAIGLPGPPTPGVWEPWGVAVESELVLDSDSPAPTCSLPQGYSTLALTDSEDWAGVIELDLAMSPDPGRSLGPAHRQFLQRRAAARAGLSAHGVGRFWAVYRPGVGMVAQLGIVLCGPIAAERQLARFQHVGTHPEHRGRGLASHLLGRAASWAAATGASRWEIHVDPGTPAERLYRASGLGSAGMTWQVYRGGVD